MKSKITPLGENILIKPEKASKKTQTGIYLPENASEEKPQEGIVIAVGSNKEIAIKENQYVIFRRFAGTQINIESEEYILIKYEDVLAVIEK